MRGKFIAIYGVNNMGKTTQSLRVVERLKNLGHKAEHVKYPVYDIEPSGVFINKVLRSGKQKISERELQLWFAVNRHQFQPKLEEMLNAGINVIAEDYAETGIAWGVTKGEDLNWLETVNEGVLKPDLSILIEGERIHAATEKGHVHEENNDLVDRCYETFLFLKDRYKWQSVQLQDNWNKTTELLMEKVLKSIEE